MLPAKKIQVRRSAAEGCSSPAARVSICQTVFTISRRLLHPKPAFRPPPGPGKPYLTLHKAISASAGSWRWDVAPASLPQTRANLWCPRVLTREMTLETCPPHAEGPGGCSSTAAPGFHEDFPRYNAHAPPWSSSRHCNPPLPLNADRKWMPVDLHAQPMRYPAAKRPNIPRSRTCSLTRASSGRRSTLLPWFRVNHGPRGHVTPNSRRAQQPQQPRQLRCFRHISAKAQSRGPPSPIRRRRPRRRTARRP